NLKKPADLSQRVIFKAKKSNSDKNSAKEKQGAESKPTKEKSKKSATTSKLSFDLEEENYDSDPHVRSER
ncbi:hypothetical protein Bhyg_08867, partial [Pseudolycoriella hygida]